MFWWIWCFDCGLAIGLRYVWVLFNSVVLYNVISFGILVISFCLLLIGLGCLFSFAGVLGVFIICLDVGRFWVCVDVFVASLRLFVGLVDCFDCFGFMFVCCI